MTVYVLDAPNPAVVPRGHAQRDHLGWEMTDTTLSRPYFLPTRDWPQTFGGTSGGLKAILRRGILQG